VVDCFWTAAALLVEKGEFSAMKLTSYFSRFLLGISLVALPVTVLAQSNTPSNPNPYGGASNSSAQSSMNNHSANLTAMDKKFLDQAAQGGMAEVELGHMAAEKASSLEVKKFGERMVRDHTKANDQLKQVASQDGITLPDNLDAKDRMLKERLSKASGQSFDALYMRNMVKDHKADVADFAQEGKSSNDNVAQFAKTTLPVLKSHLREAEKIAPQVQASSNKGAAE
jgi:putative membrane protein